MVAAASSCAAGASLTKPALLVGEVCCASVFGLFRNPLMAGSTNMGRGLSEAMDAIPLQLSSKSFTGLDQASALGHAPGVQGVPPHDADLVDR